MAHDDEFDEYVEERPEPAGGSQRLLIIILSVGCLALGVSNVVLATRVTQLRRALVAERPTTAGAPAVAPATPTTERPAVAAVDAEPPAAAPAPAADRADVRPPPSERRAPAPPRTAARPNTPEWPAAPEPPAPAASIASAPAPAASEPPPPRLDLPPRTQQREQARVAAVTRTADRSVGGPASRERATASWMVQEYGPAVAESRARAVADFYGAHSPEGAYWRRVLAEIIATRR